MSTFLHQNQTVISSKSIHRPFPILTKGGGVIVYRHQIDSITFIKCLKNKSANKIDGGGGRGESQKVVVTFSNDFT